MNHPMPDIAPIENPQSTQPLDDAAIARLQNDLPDDEILYDLAELFRVFGDSTRIKILYALFESELCVNDIAQSWASRKARSATSCGCSKPASWSSSGGTAKPSTTRWTTTTSAA